MDLELTGKTALVTGSFRGTGMIIADSLLKEGVKTIVHGLKPNQAEEAQISPQKMVAAHS